MSLGLSTMEKMMKQYGATRVSKDAEEQMKKALEETAEKITVAAVKTAQHAGRKTLRGDDIKLVRGIADTDG